jgi:hypothetical protein
MIAAVFFETTSGIAACAWDVAISVAIEITSGFRNFRSILSPQLPT